MLQFFMGFIKSILYIVIFLVSFPLFSQKVAVVLSGGGAKGLAHVGVLRVLEENDIPIDYIVGTSMGGLIGGFYAAGYSPDHIEEIIKSDDFMNWVNGVVNDQYNYYYTKSDDNASWINLQLSLDSTLNAKLNSNLAQDMALNFALTEMLARPSQAANYNFDSLFVPFRAMAAEIFTQQEVVLKEGALNDALRATMTVPLFYRPIRVDGKLLFDGGIYNNFPTDIAQNEFDPDVIIGVNVSSKVFNEYPFKEDEGLINNSLFYMILDKSDTESLSDKDVVIEPNLERYTALDFAKSNAIMDSGYVATLGKIKEVKSKIKRRVSCESLSEKRNQYLLKMKPLMFNNIIFKGFSIPQISYIKSLFSYEKEIFSITDIKKGYYKLVSEDYFKDIYPNIIYNKQAEGFDFEIAATPKKDLIIELGGNIASRSISQVFLGLQFHNFNGALMEHNVNFYSGRFYQSAQLKSRINFPGRSQFYLEPGLVFNKWDYLNSRDILLEDNNPPAILDQIDRRFNIDLGIPVGLKYKLVFNGSYFNNRDKFSNDRIFSSSDTLDLLRFNGFRYGVNISQNSLNRKQYPSSGSYFNFSLDYFDGNERYFPGSTSVKDGIQSSSRQWLRMKLAYEKYVLKTRHYSLGYSLESVFSNQPFFSTYRASIINTPVYRPLQDSQTLFLEDYRAHKYLAAGIKNIFSIDAHLDFRLEAHVFKPIHQISESTNDQLPFYEEFDDSFSTIGSAGFVYHSPLGPISIHGNYYQNASKKFGLLMHIGYLIYNKRSLD